VKVGELAAHFGVHRDTVSEVLDRHGVVRRQAGLAPDLLSEVIALSRDSGPGSTKGRRIAPPAARMASTELCGAPTQLRSGNLPSSSP
jgi:hypothetical protein